MLAGSGVVAGFELASHPLMMGEKNKRLIPPLPSVQQENSSTAEQQLHLVDNNQYTQQLRETLTYRLSCRLRPGPTRSRLDDPLPALHPDPLPPRGEDCHSSPAGPAALSNRASVLPVCRSCAVVVLPTLSQLQQGPPSLSRVLFSGHLCTVYSTALNEQSCYSGVSHQGAVRLLFCPREKREKGWIGWEREERENCYWLGCVVLTRGLLGCLAAWSLVCVFCSSLLVWFAPVLPVRLPRWVRREITQKKQM